MGCRYRLLQTETLVLIEPLEEFATSRRDRLYFSTAFHPQTDGQSEQVIQILEDMLRACVLDLAEGWSHYLPLVVFAYNNSYQQAFGWPCMKLCMGVGVNPLFAGMI